MNRVRFIIKSTKGYIKPGHKYIRRIGTAGNYKYEYEDINVKENIPKKTKDMILEEDIVKQGGEPDILVDRYDDERYRILFDFNWNDPNWHKLKNTVKEAGAKYDGIGKQWLVTDKVLDKLFDTIDNIAISEEAKNMIDKRRERIEQIKKQQQLENEKKLKAAQESDNEYQNRLNEKAVNNELTYRKNYKLSTDDGKKHSKLLWIDDKGVAHFSKPPKDAKMMDNPWRSNYYTEAKIMALDEDYEPQNWTLNRITREAKKILSMEKVTDINQEIDVKILVKRPEEITDEDCLQILAYAKKAGMIKEVERGENKGKLVIVKNKSNYWDSVSDVDKKIRIIMNKIIGTSTNNYVNNYVMPDKFPLYWFKQGNADFDEMREYYKENADINNLIDSYKDTEHIYAIKLIQMIKDYNKGQANTAMKKLFSERTIGDKTIQEEIKEAKKSGTEIDKFKAKVLSEFDNPNPIPIPKIKEGVNLWSHQNRFLNWMLAANKGVIGADTGLGKTLMTLSYIMKMQAEDKITGGILFLPGSVMYSWEPELRDKFKGKFNILYIDGTVKQKKEAIKRLKKEKFDLVVCSHGLISTSPESLQHKILKDVMDYTKNYALIYDEAHRGLMNMSNFAYKNLKELSNHKYKFLLTGTAARNKPSDVKNLIDLLYPGVLGSTKSFNAKYTQLIGKNKTPVPVNMEAMWDEVKPFCPVMSKYSPLVDVKFPKAIYTTETLKTEPEQEEYIEAAQASMLESLLAVKNPDHLTREESSHIFAVLQKMRETLFDPRMVNDKYNGSSALIDRTIDLIKDKMSVSLVDKEHKPGASIIVSAYKKPFPQYAEMLKEKLGLKDSEIALITAEVDKKKRPQIENDVNSGKIKVLLMGIGAGGVGMNFQKGADSIFLLADPWTYADVKQAADRIVRPGSKYDHVYITDFKFHGSNKASTGISEFVKNKIKIKRAMHEAADIEGLMRQIKETSSFDDYLKALGLTREEYNKIKKQRKIKKSIYIRYIIRM